MSDAVPDHLKYTSDHEWVDDGTPVTVGITRNAADALGDLVYVELPEAGSQVTAGTVCGEVESTKSVSDLFAPMSGNVVEVNAQLEAQPELLNSDPYGEGWICVIDPGDASQADSLLDAEGYRSLISD